MSSPIIEELLQRIEKLENKKKEILWENPNPNEAFGTKTIEFENPNKIEDVYLVCTYTSNNDRLLYIPIKLGKQFWVEKMSINAPGGAGYLNLCASTTWNTSTLTSINYYVRDNLTASSTKINSDDTSLIPLRIEER